LRSCNDSAGTHFSTSESDFGTDGKATTFSHEFMVYSRTAVSTLIVAASWWVLVSLCSGETKSFVERPDPLLTDRLFTTYATDTFLTSEFFIRTGMPLPHLTTVTGRFFRKVYSIDRILQDSRNHGISGSTFTTRRTRNESGKQLLEGEWDCCEVVLSDL
jgi:hypothetical protein